jgi:hypothetical protein
VLLPLGGFIENAVINYEIRQASFFMLTGNLLSSTEATNSIEKSQKLLAIMEKETFDDAFLFNDSTLNIFSYFQYIEIFQIAFVTCFLLMLSLFFPKQAILTRFINKLTFIYFLFIF